ncbi:fumarylacetoacetate hydrolase family protein [Parahaliea maris]|uniref:Fumarylacetoacetate hydrolase family protein n=1 Tax=Parahaliea maris TaxID=2716870 RepID=A0A5C9AA51_9GAMM|nr:fumarylacetoacetate hydrolase family protein [Parahaliea maris]TXS96477.1 fumarylacetoacetate hydrolase family protein [Parahaliea maris]
MKLASLQAGRDGVLVVVSSDLQRKLAAGITLQTALDHWDEHQPQLQALSDRVEAGEGDPFDEAACASPLPRAYQWADGSAYVNHVELVRKARGAEMPESFWTDPLMYQGGSDTFLGPRDPIVMPTTDWGIDFEGEIAVVTGDVPMGASVEEAAASIRLVMLVNDVSLRNLIPGELGKGFGFFQSKPSSAFSPVCVTPDELGDAWDGGRLHLPLLVSYNGEAFGKANAGVDMTFDFPTLVAHAAKTRPLGAGTIIGSGTVSNKDADGAPGRPVSEGGLGYSCIAEIRMIETIASGAPKTGFMAYGDRVRIEMLDAAGSSIFGAIDQQVCSPQ